MKRKIRISVRTEGEMDIGDSAARSESTAADEVTYKVTDIEGSDMTKKIQTVKAVSSIFGQKSTRIGDDTSLRFWGAAAASVGIITAVICHQTVLE